MQVIREGSTTIIAVSGGRETMLAHLDKAAVCLAQTLERNRLAFPTEGGSAQFNARRENDALLAAQNFITDLARQIGGARG